MTRIFLFLALIATFVEATVAAMPPNVVLIFCDDLGYADISCFGGKVSTPHIDSLATEGARFTDFYVSQAVCSASRAALMTGCYSNRVGIMGALPPSAKIGINRSEFTMAEMFKSRGYATAIFGKWHLGDAPRFLPTKHGFDEYVGLPYSNDMWPNHPTRKDWPDLPLIDGEKVVKLNPDQRQLTTWYTEHAVSFIERNKDRPFLLYVPHSMPHVPIHVSDKFAGKSGHGLYGDVIQEIDWSVGQILETLSRLRLSDNTLVIFTSDNGPWLSYGDHAGSAEPLREGKVTMFDGGARVPCVMRWPGNIKPGTVCREVTATIDLLPTFAALAGATLPTDRIIDGKDIGPLMRGEPNAKSPHVAYYFYWNRELQAVRSGKWKLHFPHKYGHVKTPGKGGLPGEYLPAQAIEKSLFDMEADPGETKNIAADHPDVLKWLEAYAEQAREDLGDSLTRREGKNVRAPGAVPTATSKASD
jgi:arylsulfatase A